MRELESCDEIGRGKIDFTKRSSPVCVEVDTQAASGLDAFRQCRQRSEVENPGRRSDRLDPDRIVTKEHLRKSTTCAVGRAHEHDRKRLFRVFAFWTNPQHLSLRVR